MGQSCQCSSQRKPTQSRFRGVKMEPLKLGSGSWWGHPRQGISDKIQFVNEPVESHQDNDSLHQWSGICLELLKLTLFGVGHLFILRHSYWQIILYVSCSSTWSRCSWCETPGPFLRIKSLLQSYDDLSSIRMHVFHV